MATFNPNDDLKRRKQLVDQLAEQQRNYSPYQESEYVAGLKQAATDAKDAIDNYGPFQFSKQDMYDQLENSYLNRRKFTWDADSDALYQMYKDKYIQGGKLAMQDTMGQAAALTGGYGNSYAATVGNQAYQSYLGKLNEVVPELYNLALQRYQVEGQDMADRLGLLQKDRGVEYGEYTDQYGRLSDTYNRNYNLYGDERGRELDAYNTGYNRLVDALNYANSDYDSEYSRSYADFRNNIADQQAAASLSASRSGSGSGSGSGDNNVPLYTYSYKDDDGFTHFQYNGKDVKKETGVNPYTGQKHKDAKYGTFNNGYQPNNVGGHKLTATGKTYNMNGRVENVYSAYGGPRGNTLKYYVWNGMINDYQELTRSQYNQL